MKPLQHAPQRSDEQLMVAYAAGDDDAFDQLYEKYQPMLSSVVRRWIGNPDEVRDLVQQSFLQVHRARQRFDADRALKPWLVTIAANLTRDHLRRSVRLRSLQRERRDEAPTTVDPVEVAETQRIVQDGLRRLRPVERKVLELRWFHGLSLHDIAAELGLTYTATKLRSFRARNALRDVIQKQALGTAA